jgi:hypothetical protein
MFNPFFADAAKPFNPANALYEKPNLPQPVPVVAMKLRDKFDPNIFRTLCQVAIIDGYTSRQALREKFGDAIPRNVEKLSETNLWPVPNPALTRQILDFFADCPIQPIGSTLPWRHAQCAQPEVEPTLPG